MTKLHLYRFHCCKYSVLQGNLQFVPSKDVECPTLDCSAITAQKPCPEAKPLKNVFEFQGMECPNCSTDWDPDSCKSASDPERKTEDKENNQRKMSGEL